MKTLKPENITKLARKPVSFTSTFADGKLMTMCPNGKATLENPDDGYDQRWIIIPVKENEVLLCSSKQKNMICHRMTDEGNITTKPLSDDIEDCVWKVGKGGEIYQDNPKGGERYLWMADDKLFVTLDGFLAEKWIPLDGIQHPVDFNIDKKNNISIFFILFLCILIFALFYFRGSELKL